MKKAIRCLYKVVELMSGFMVILMVLFVLIQVIFRLLRLPAPWTEEMSRFLYVYITFFGSVLAMRDREHIRIDLLLNRLGQRALNAANGVISILVAIFFAFFIRGCWTVFLTSGNVASVSFTWFKHYYLYGPVLVCGVLMMIICIVQAISDLRRAILNIREVEEE